MSKDTVRSIRTHEKDNVSVIVSPAGGNAGDVTDLDVELFCTVPFGHKFALVNIHEGDAVVRYGEVIGYANTEIPKGHRVQAQMIRLPDPPVLDDLSIASGQIDEQPRLEGFTFDGYRNDDGSVGTKNILGIATSVQCVAGVANYAVKRIKEELLPRFPNVDDVVAINHAYGCGVAIDAPDAVIPIRTLRNILHNPNFGGEVMMVGLGCEKLQPNRLIRNSQSNSLNISGPGRSADESILSLQDDRFHGFGEMISGIMDDAEKHLERLNMRRREPCPVTGLVVGMQCGGSDALSGVTANPAVGYAADLIVRAGGSVLFSEVTEVRDAIHLLTPRAASQNVGQALIEEMRWFDDYLDQGHVDRSANPSPGNKGGGLSNVVEKALGSIAKSGNSTIVDVLSPGERIRRRGLTFAATPASDFICGTLQLASGMNTHVFTTGRGTPYGLAMAPVVKVATNSALAERWHDLIDFDAGRIAAGETTTTKAGWELFYLILDVASGRKTVAADKLGLHNDLALFNPAPVT